MTNWVYRMRIFVDARGIDL